MERPCGPRKSSRNPDAYSKAELVDLVSSMLDMKKSVVTKLTVEQLCVNINIFFFYKVML